MVPNLLSLEEIECPFYNSSTKEFNIGEELWKFVTCRSTHIFPVIIFGMLKKISYLFLERKLKDAVKVQQKLLNEFKASLINNGPDFILLNASGVGISLYLLLKSFKFYF